MLPREYEKSIERSVNRVELGWPPESHLASEEHFVWSDTDMRGLTWEGACYTLNVEREILVRGAGDLSAAEEAVLDEEYFDLDGLDVGVASAVVARKQRGLAGRCRGPIPRT